MKMYSEFKINQIKNVQHFKALSYYISSINTPLWKVKPFQIYSHDAQTEICVCSSSVRLDKRQIDNIDQWWITDGFSDDVKACCISQQNFH